MTVKNLDPSGEGHHAAGPSAPEPSTPLRQETVVTHRANEDVAEQRSSGGPAVMVAPESSPAAGVASSRTVVRDEVGRGRNTVAQLGQIIWFAVGFVEVVLALRILLKALGAGPTAGFTQLVLGFTNPLVMPFLGIFPNAGIDVFEFEPASLVAMLVYLLVGVGLAKIVRIIYGETRQTA